MLMVIGELYQWVIILTLDKKILKYNGKNPAN